MSKFLVQGRDAGGVLDRLSANHVDGETGRHHLHPVAQRGRHRSRPTSPSPSSTTSGSGWSRPTPPTATSRRWMRRHLGGHARVRHRRDVGLRADQRPGPPLARAAAVAHRRPTCPTTRSRSGPPARSTSASRGCCACGSPTSASSATSSTCPAEQAAHVYDRLVAAGPAYGLRHAGLKALASLRMEKGYRDYGHDIDNTDSVLEAGLGFAVDLDKPGGFLGARRGAGEEGGGPAAPRLVQVLADRPRAAAVPRRARAARRRAGRLRPRRRRTASPSVAPSASRWSRPASRRPGVDRRRPSGRSRSPAGSVPGTASLRPLYDPTNEKIKL